MDMVYEALTSILYIVVSCGVAILTRSILKSDKYKKIARVVMAAEKMYEDIPKSGSEKRTYVINYLKSNRISFSEDEIDSIINSVILGIEKGSIAEVK